MTIDIVAFYARSLYDSQTGLIGLTSDLWGRLMLDDYPIEAVQQAYRRAWILSYVKKDGIGAEFGVFRGHFSEVIVRTTNPLKLFLVDPWRILTNIFEWGEHPYVLKLTRNNTLTAQEAMDETIARVGSHPAVECIEITLEAFCSNFSAYSDNPLDFAYLDTSHTYEDTVAQLRLIDSVLAPDGVIVGDDWETDASHPHHGVFRAVNEFVKVSNYQFVVAGPDAQFCIRRSPTYEAAN